MKIFALLFLLTTSAAISIFAQTPFPLEPGVSQTMAKWRAANYSDVRYKLNITLEKGAPTMRGTIEIRVKIGETGGNATVKERVNSAINDTLVNTRVSAPEIILDWRKIRGKEDLSKISNVFLNEKAAKFEEINEHLVFKDGVKVGENLIKLDFTSPIATSGAAVTRYVDREDGAEYIYSLFVPSDASTAFPVFDQPDLKARFSLTLAVPVEWKTISNSEIKLTVTQHITAPTVEMLKSGSSPMRYHIFEETKPISTYVFAFATGDFVALDERGIVIKKMPSSYREEISEKAKQTSVKKDIADTSKVYVRKSQAEKFKQHSSEVFRLNREGVKFLESYFDFKFPFPKYDLVLIPEFPFGGMEHAGATFLRESSVIFPSEPTANDHISRANVIFHEAAHQWFGDTVTMKWFDDLWLKEGFAEFMAYKTLENCMPEYNAWKAFYERNKPLAYLTDSTRGTTPIYQEIPNLSAAKSAYGNIVYRKAPSFLRQAEFYLGEDKFQTAVRAFLKKHQFANAEWTDLVKEFETASNQDLKDWANVWVKQRGTPIFKSYIRESDAGGKDYLIIQKNILQEPGIWREKVKILAIASDDSTPRVPKILDNRMNYVAEIKENDKFIFPNYQDYGYGIFLLDEKSREYVLKNIQNEKDDFLRSMMWGTLWDSVREAELAPKDYVELVIKNFSSELRLQPRNDEGEITSKGVTLNIVEKDELTIQTILARVSTAMNYYLSAAQAAELAPKLEDLLIDKMQNAPTLGQRITFYRAFLNIALSDKGKNVLKKVLTGEFRIEGFNCRGDSCGRPMSEAKNGSASRLIGQAQDLPLQTAPTILKTKDKFDIITKLAILGDPDAQKLLDDLRKTEISDEAKRYAYAVGAAFPAKEGKEKYFNDFLNDKVLSESWIESAFVPFNSPRHSELTLPFLERALAELPNLKRSRKIFFVNGWLAAFIGGQKDEKALAQVNKFLADNPNLDKDLRLKILENLDVIERAVKIRAKYGK
jgi:aminopeptidase N